MDFETVFSVLEKEKSTGELQPLNTNFYKEVSEFVASVKDSASKSELANLEKMVSQLKEKRKQKILIYIAYNRRLPEPVPEEEETLYNEIVKILNKGEKKAETAKIKILADLPEIITPEGKKLGPFKNGEVIELEDQNDINFVITNKIGEKV
ncbi:MAG: hypothetical protein ACP5TJ_03155 [Candidatus Micrarchaeia archaeon]